MDAAKMKEILRTQYGINSEEEFNEAVEKSKGIDIGIFSMPFNEKEEKAQSVA